METTAAPTAPAPLWAAMHARRRLQAATLSRADIPLDAGVYAWYETGLVVYVGKAVSLLKRIWLCHLAESPSMGNSALRRNAAEDLGFGTAARIKNRSYRLTPAQLSAVNARVRSWSVAWVVCASPRAARDLEKAMKNEWRPRLTKR